MKGIYHHALYLQFLTVKQNLGDKNLNMMVGWEMLRQEGWYQTTRAAINRGQTVSSHDA
jgi:hypothetical protein